MKKKFLTAVLTVTMALAMSINAFAFVPVVGWKSEQLGDSTHWHYDKTGYGNFAVNEWLWIDGNGDGVAECYNFDGTSFMRANTTTPDGYTVNADGAWIVDGVVQTKQVGQETAQQPEPEQSNIQAVNLDSLQPVSKVSGCGDIEENVRTAQGALWSKVMSMDRYVSPTKTPHVEYFVGGSYNTFSATIAPAKGFGTETEYYLEVYGDNDNLLATSDYIDYKTSPFEFSVDISGQQYVKLVLCKESGKDFNWEAGTYCNVYFNNAQFK